MRKNIEMREIDSLRDALAEAERERQSLRNTCVALDKYNDELESRAERAEDALDNVRELLREAWDGVANLHTALAEARELLREAIPHLVGNNHWDGVARIQAHLALAEANEMVIIDSRKEKRISKES